MSWLPGTASSGGPSAREPCLCLTELFDPTSMREVSRRDHELGSTSSTSAASAPPGRVPRGARRGDRRRGERASPRPTEAIHSMRMSEQTPEIFDDLYLGLQAGGALRKQRRGEELTVEEDRRSPAGSVFPCGGRASRSARSRSARSGSASRSAVSCSAAGARPDASGCSAFRGAGHDASCADAPRRHDLPTASRIHRGLDREPGWSPDRLRPRVLRVVEGMDAPARRRGAAASGTGWTAIDLRGHGDSEGATGALDRAGRRWPRSPTSVSWTRPSRAARASGPTTSMRRSPG